MRYLDASEGEMGWSEPTAKPDEPHSIGYKTYAGISGYAVVFKGPQPDSAMAGDAVTIGSVIAETVGLVTAPCMLYVGWADTSVEISSFDDVHLLNDVKSSTTVSSYTFTMPDRDVNVWVVLHDW